MHSCVEIITDAQLDLCSFFVFSSLVCCQLDFPPMTTSLPTQIVVDDCLLEYELPKPASCGMFGQERPVSSQGPGFHTIRDDCPRPRFQGLCLAKSVPLIAAMPVEPCVESPDSQLLFDPVEPAPQHLGC